MFDAEEPDLAVGPGQPMLGIRLRGLRLRLGMSQADLAGGLLSASAISLVESGRRQPTEDTITKLAHRLGCPPEYLRSGVRARSEVGYRLAVVTAETLLAAGRVAEARVRFEQLRHDDEPASSYLADRARLGHAIAVEAGGEPGTALAELTTLIDAAKVSCLALEAARSRCLRALGRRRGSLDVALPAIETAEAIGIDGVAAYSELVRLALMEFDAGGQTDDAMRLARKHLGPHPGSADQDRPLAYLHASERAASAGKEDEALLLAERALAGYAEVADVTAAARLCVTAARILLSGGPDDIAGAVRSATAAHAVLSTVDGKERAACEMVLAKGAYLTGAVDEAAQWAERALCGEDTGDLDLVRANVMLGQCRRRADLATGAERSAQAAERMLRALPASRDAAEVRCELAELLRTVGKSERALDFYQEALTMLGVRGPCERA